MPTKVEGTPHHQREIAVRARLLRAMTKLPAGTHGVTQWGIMARKCREVAEAQGFKWFKPSVKNGKISKDASTSLRRFAEGKQGAYEWVLDAIEQTCIVIEREHREARQAAGVTNTGNISDGAPIPDNPGIPLVPLANTVTTHQDPPPSVWRSAAEDGPLPGPITPDPEIEAIASVIRTLDPLNDEQLERVVTYYVARRGYIVTLKEDA